jgi:G3E family GTPase
VSAVQGALDPGWLTERGASEAAGQAEVSAGFIAEDVEASHTDNIRSFTLTETSPVAWEPFARSMETLIALRGADLLRVKGILDVEGCSGPVVVQFVQHLAHPPIEMEAWPEGPRVSRLVFITRGVGEREVRDLFAAVRALAARAS